MRDTVLRKYLLVNKCLCTTGFICLLFFVAAQAQQGQNRSQEESPSAQNKISPPVSMPSAPANQTDIKQVESPVQSSKSSNQENNGWGKPITRAEWMQIGINVLLFLVVLSQTLIYLQQRNIMHRQVETARVSERAYVGIKMVQTKDFVIGQTPIVHVVILNGGRTPAWKVKVPSTLRIVEPTGVPDEHFETSDKESSTFLPAGIAIDFNYPFPFVLTSKWHRAITTGERRVFLSGEVHFEDCWGEKRIFPFKCAYKYKTGGWGDYKDPKETEGKLSIIK
jgi:hypothetical protein